ncbi:hypothetical protein BB561_003410 [Smittium simulii]|uniref:Superoxide dismutase n=1 Tax=Smittium simulii TaxID=133385 RepID=A0A2T9YLJ0_9FUNG|nr:hypothetical protein BB561_003410 [Smittium simulii]
MLFSPAKFSVAQACSQLSRNFFNKNITSGYKAAGAGIRLKHTLPEFHVEFSAFAPVWSEEIVKNHYTGNHALYVKNLNDTETKLQDAISSGKTVEAGNLHRNLRFNSGGHVNHSRLWKFITPVCNGGGKVIDGSLKKQIESIWGTVENMMLALNNTTATIQGSGWGWLAVNKQTLNLELITTPNQDTPEYYGYLHLFGIDAWEHAFYLDYKTAKAAYFKNIWQIANWKQIQKNYDIAMATKA